MKKCQKCPTNTYSDESAGLCTACPQRSLANEDHTKCGNKTGGIVFYLLERKGAGIVALRGRSQKTSSALEGGGSSKDVFPRRLNHFSY